MQAQVISKPRGRVVVKENLQPFTVEHFKRWALRLTLDNGEKWVPEPFQLAFVADVFAGYAQCWLIVPEGNGKTTLCAGLALYVCEFSPRPAEIPIAASSRDQGQIMFRQAEGFILRSPRLYDSVHSQIQKIRGKRTLDRPRFVALPGYRRVEHYQGSRIQVHAADEGTGDGVIFDKAFIDELHRHRSLGLLRTWTGKRFKRKGQVVVISTSGELGSEFEETRELIRQAATETKREGCFLRAVAGGIVLHEWAVPEDGNIEDLQLVKAANPFSAVTISGLREKRNDPTMTVEHWGRLTCNLPMRSGRAAVTEGEWFSAKTTETIPPGQPIWLGLDLAWKWDTTALVPFWIRDPEFRLFGPATVLIPPRDGNSLDPNKVEKALIDIHHRNPIHTVVMDPTKAEQLGEWIQAELGAKVIAHGTTNQYAVLDYERFMEALRTGRLHHAGDRALSSHVLSAIARITPDGRARFDRAARPGGNEDRRAIDALTAAAMVHCVATETQPVEQPVFMAKL